MHNRQFSLIAIAILGLAACARSPANPQIEVQNAWARPAPVAGGNGAIYFRLVNRGNEADQLLGGETALAAAVELHVTMEMDGGAMGMAPLSGIEIPARGDAELIPGGMHIMLVNLNRPLAAGDLFPITLQFEKSSAMRLEVEVRDP